MEEDCCVTRRRLHVLLVMKLIRPRRPVQRPTKKKNLRHLTADIVAAVEEAASRARYVSSPYHRSARSRMGGMAARRWPTASKCSPEWTVETATRALREAIRSGLISESWRGGFPALVWHLEGDVLYEARLSNSGRGEYHAYPLEDKREWPAPLRNRL
jgi:hypothetical protein